jgi:predicted nucleic acid-binding protein
MQSYFADTSFWIALVDRRDSHHIQAVELSQQISGRIVTTEAVVLETANSLARPDWRPQVIGLINHLKQRSDVSILPLTPDLWNRGWTLYCRRADKAWSLMDCISFDVMQELGIADALTADSDFAQSGFRVLLSSRE